MIFYLRKKNFKSKKEKKFLIQPHGLNYSWNFYIASNFSGR